MFVFLFFILINSNTYIIFIFIFQGKINRKSLKTKACRRSLPTGPGVKHGPYKYMKVSYTPLKKVHDRPPTPHYKKKLYKISPAYCPTSPAYPPTSPPYSPSSPSSYLENVQTPPSLKRVTYQPRKLF